MGRARRVPDPAGRRLLGVAGPTNTITENHAEVFSGVAVSFVVPGGGAAELGLPDVAFFAVFLAASVRFGLRPFWTWLGMTAGLVADDDLRRLVGPDGPAGAPGHLARVPARERRPALAAPAHEPGSIRTLTDPGRGRSAVHETDERLFDEMAARLARGAIVPFLGAGASLCDRPVRRSSGSPQGWEIGAELPSGAELATYLAMRGEYPPFPDAPLPEELDLMRVAQYLEWKQGEHQLYRYLREVFASEYEPTSLHLMLARAARALAEAGLPQLLVVTMNYDDLVEQAFASEGLEYDVVWYEAKSYADERGRFWHRPPGDVRHLISRPERYTGLRPRLERPVVLKLHGSVNREHPDRDSYVVTEDDYIGYLTGGDVRAKLPIVLSRMLTRNSLLFLGYSLSDDWDMRAALQQLEGTRPDSLRSWAVLRGSADPGRQKIEQQLWSSFKNVDLVRIELRQYVDAVSARLEGQMGLPLSTTSDSDRFLPWLEGTGAAADPPLSPYVGPRSFRADDRGFFFGRAYEVEIVASSLLSSRLTILTGPTGVGKSSLLNAGVLPDLQLEAAATAAETSFAACVLRSWHDDPVQGLWKAARRALQADSAEPELPRRGAPLAHALRELTDAAGATLLVVLDQFEEYFRVPGR